MISIEEMKDLKVYSRPFYLPTVSKDEKKNSAIFLMTPNYESSKQMMLSKLFINRRNAFQSYYMDRNINMYISSKGKTATKESYTSEEFYSDYIEEASRSELPDSVFGLPKKRKYPLDSAKHVRSAIKFFNYCDKEDEAELAKNIQRAMKKYHVKDVNIGKNNRLSHYLNEMQFMVHESECKVYYEPRALEKVYGYYTKVNNSYNACVQVEGIKHPLRGRSEIAIFRNKQIYMDTKENHDDTDKYRLPGGSWNENENPMDAAIRETQEEARLNVKDVKYCCTFIEDFDDPADWVKQNVPEEHWWFGYYTMLYIGVYDSKNTEPVEDEDKDNNMAKRGKWYNIDDVYNDLPEHHKYAIDMYLKSRPDLGVVKESIVNNMEFGDTIDPSTIFDDYYISDKDVEYTDIASIQYDDFYNALVKGAYNQGDYFVYTKDIDHTPLLLGKIHRYTDTVDNWEWISVEDGVDTENIVEAVNLNAFDSIFLTPNKVDNIPDDAYNSTMADAIINQAPGTGDFYVYTKSDTGSPVLLGKINRFGDIGWDWSSDAPENEVVSEKFGGKDGLSARYLTRHLKLKRSKTFKAHKNITDSIGISIPTLSVPKPKVKQETDDITDKDDINVDDLEEKFYARVSDDMIVFTEDAKNDAYLRSIMYNERMTQDKELLTFYEQVKSDIPYIKYTFTKLPRYQNKNLFYDVSFYNQLFFKNNTKPNLKTLDIYTDLMERFLHYEGLKSYKIKTVFIPIHDWEDNEKTKMWMYTKGCNPISIIYQGVVNNPKRIVKMFKGMNVIFFDTNRYFKVDFSAIEDYNKFANKFRLLITKFQNNEEVSIEDKDINTNGDSKNAIMTTIIDKIETSRGISLKDDKDIPPEPTSAKEIISAEEKKELMGSIEKAAASSDNVDDALDKLDNERIKEILADLAAEAEENAVMNTARASRMTKLQDDFVDKKIKNTPIRELLNNDTASKDELPKSSIPVSTVEKEQWENLTFVNFDKEYDVNSDIVKILYKLSTVTYPIGIRNIDVRDNSTSEDYVDLYTVELEDFRGKRNTIKFDVPKFLNNDKYLLLRGNQKTIQNQLQNMPILKSDQDTCQIITNYNKIFVRTFGTSSGKSNSIASRVIKALNKYKGEAINSIEGNCGKLAFKFELPIDYIDIGNSFIKIETPNYIVYFDQSEIARTYTDIKYNEGIPFAYYKKDKSLIYYKGGEIFSGVLLDLLCSEDASFKDTFDTTIATVRSTYSKCSILNTEIPLVVVCAYSEGLEATMKKGNVRYKLVEKLTKEDRNNIYVEWIKFNDGYILYELDYNSSLLMNGLKECDTDNYSLADINSKTMYTDFLANFGGRIKGDGLDNFYDCLVDPITEEILEHLSLPKDYVSLLTYANSLLADNKFIKHTDISNKRLRRKELIAVYVYHVLFNVSYARYANDIRHSRNAAAFTVKQSAVIDALLEDCTASDYSVANGINDVETSREVTSKGQQGMNSDRAYSLDKRGYDNTMINELAMSTGFAANVGITRQATIDMSVEGKRGYIKANSSTDKMSTTKSLCITEALNPMGVTCDYPFRTAMTFIQTARHSMRTDSSDPLLMTNGSDEAMTYLVSDMFVHRAKMDGNIKDYVEGEYIIIEYKDGTYDYINLKQSTQKNSDGGFYIPVQHVPAKNIKVGAKVKADEVITYDKDSFSNSLGETDDIAYNVGTLSKIAILSTDEGYEDSAAVSESLCERMATNIILKEDKRLSKDTNIYNMVKVGDHVREGDTLMVYQTSYEEDDMNILLKNLVNDPNDISELGRVPIKSHHTGTVVDIKMYRTCPIEEMSESLAKAFIAYEKPIKTLKNKLEKDNIEAAKLLPATYELPPVGKLKNGEDMVLIEIYVQVHDIMAIGDKLVFDRANKGVVQEIFSTELAPYTDFRPNEEISAFANISSFNSRMVTSPMKIGAVNKLLIELDRSVKDILGIPYDDSKI